MKIDRYFEEEDEDSTQVFSEDEAHLESAETITEVVEEEQRVTTRSMARKKIDNQNLKIKLEYEDWKNAIKSKRFSKIKEETPPRLVESPRKINFGIYFWLIVILIIFLFIVYLPRLLFYNHQHMLFKSLTHCDSSPWAKFGCLFEDTIKSKYNHIVAPNSWRVVTVAIDMILSKTSRNQKPIGPSVILFVGSQKNSHNVKCLLHDLSRFISDAYSEQASIMLSGSLTNLKEINQKFAQTFETNKLHSIALEGINHLKGADAFSLHQFTDHQHAPFSEAVILLSAYTSTPLSDPNLKLKEMEHIANELLEKSWINTLSGDTIASLLSRITSSVAIVLDSDQFSPVKCNLNH